jgi:periplasmic copper chaperone A
MKLFAAAVAAFVATAVPLAAHAAPQVSAAWSRPAVQGATGVGYMTLSNAGPADALVAVQTPLSKSVMIHQSSVAGGMASMKMVDRVALPTGGRVTFGPGGYHLMFMGLVKPLKVGEALPATLVFASGARIKASFVVGLAPPVAGHDHH